METLTIEYQPSFKEKLLAFLNSFEADEIKIVRKDLDFEANKEILQERLKIIRAGNSETISIDDYEIMIQNEITK